MRHELRSRVGFMVVLPSIVVSVLVLSCERSRVAMGTVSPAKPKACDEGTQLPCNCDNRDLPLATTSEPASVCVMGGFQTATFLGFESMSAWSWSAFNWPVSEVNGVPDYDKTLENRPKDGSTVWESWKTTSEVFLPGGQRPAAWNSRERPLPATCRAIDVEAAKEQYAHRDEVPDDLPPRLLTEYVQADQNPLIDRNGQPVRYEKAMNEVAFDYIVENGLYSRDGIARFFERSGAKIDFPMGSVGGNRGAYLIKAAWKVLTAEDPPGWFHKAWAYVTPTFSETGISEGCALVPVGLVGMHIIYKTEVGPQWAWATFEHVRNAPTWSRLSDAQQQSKSKSYLFFDPRCKQPDCAQLNVPPEHSRPNGRRQRSQIVMQQDFGFGFVCNTSFCFTVKTLNERLAEQLSRTVWKHYKLKGTQWVQKDGSTPEQDVPMVISNSVIESYFQHTSSCLSCHSDARTLSAQDGQPIATSHESDRLFIFTEAQLETHPHQGDVR